MKKPKQKYFIWFGNKCYDTWAVSEAQAINNVKCQMGLAGDYDYHSYTPTKIEIMKTKIIDNREEIKC
jgi:hypothetical protein